MKFKECLDEFGENTLDKAELIYVARHGIDTGSTAHVASKPSRYNTLNQ